MRPAFNSAASTNKLLKSAVFCSHSRLYAPSSFRITKDKKTYFDSEFEIDQDKFISLDRGREPQTDEHIWGSVAGLFHFVRWGSFADEVKI